jgi:tetratricopeptide (TPR) repeat protein
MNQREQHFPRYVVCTALLSGLVLAIYWPVGAHQLLYDDFDYITRNATVLRGLTLEGLRWAFTTFTQCNWHPLTWLSHMLDVQLFGTAPRGHHFHNVALHAANATLLLLVLKGMTGSRWRSLAVAVLFAAHPLNVESVAWVAERKNLLSTLFLLLTLGAYVSYTRRPHFVLYLTALGGLALGLLAKPMLVTLPFVMLLLDYWPLGRMRGNRDAPSTVRLWVALAAEKVPFLALALVSSVITYRAQLAGSAVRALELYGIWFRACNAVASYIAYLGKAAWPAGLAVFYPFRGDSPEIGRVVLSALVLGGVTVLAVMTATKRPWFPVGWFWYLGTLVPVIGIVQVGDQSMADRYTYVPMIGVFMILAWTVGDLAGDRRLLRGGAVTGAILVVAVFGVNARRQVAYWKDMVTLFEHALQVTKSNPMSNYQLAFAYAERGDAVRAAQHYEEALRLFPEDDVAHVNLGVILLGFRRTDEALWHFQQAVRWNPRSWNAFYNLGVALVRQGNPWQAEGAFRSSLALKPDEPNTHYNLGIVLLQTGRPEGAASSFQTALDLQPDITGARMNLQRALSQIAPGPSTYPPREPVPVSGSR